MCIRDSIGDAYEYFMMKFAQESGKSKGQFYTPVSYTHLDVYKRQTNDFTKQSSGFRTELFKLEDMRQFQWRLEDFAREFVAPLPFEWYDENDLKNSRVNPCTFSEDEPLT